MKPLNMKYVFYALGSSLVMLSGCTSAAYVSNSSVNDDLYYVPRANKSAATSAASADSYVTENDVAKAQQRANNYSNQTISARDFAAAHNYNTTGGNKSATVDNDTIYYDGEDVDDSGYWAGGFNGTSSEQSYAERIIRFHGPFTTISYYSPVVSAAYYSPDWNVYVDGYDAYLVPTWTNPYYHSYYYGYGWGWHRPYSSWSFGFGWGYGWHSWDYWYSPYYYSWGWGNPYHHWHYYDRYYPYNYYGRYAYGHRPARYYGSPARVGGGGYTSTRTRAVSQPSRGRAATGTANGVSRSTGVSTTRSEYNRGVSRSSTTSTNSNSRVSTTNKSGSATSTASGERVSTRSTNATTNTTSRSTSVTSGASRSTSTRAASSSSTTTRSTTPASSSRSVTTNSRSTYTPSRSTTSGGSSRSVSSAPRSSSGGSSRSVSSGGSSSRGRR